MISFSRSTWAFLAVAFAMTSGAWAQFDFLAEQGASLGIPVQIRSLETSYDSEVGIIRARGDVQVSYAGSIILADEAEYHQSTGDVFARGNVSIFKLGQLVRASEAVYNLNTRVIVATEMRGGMGPFFFETQEVTLPASDVDVVQTQNTTLTTHDSQDPNWKITARRINIYPDKRVEFHGALLTMGPIPVAYIPYFSQPVDGELGYYATPGYEDAWGAYLLNQYGFIIQDHTLATAHLDYRTERGIAAGLDLESIKHKGNPHFGKLQLYYAQDQDPSLNFTGEPRPDTIDSERYRFNVQHRVYLPGPGDSTLYLDVDINKLSDEMFYLDFFPGEFIEDPNPENLLNLVKHHPRGTISLLGRFQLNDFFTTDTRQPELAIDFTRQPIFNSGLFYEGNTSYSILEEKLGSGGRRDFEGRIKTLQDLGPAATAEEADLLGSLTRRLDENGFNRFDSFHQILYPIKVREGVSVVPRAGLGYTHYSHVKGNGYSGDSSADRTYIHAGVDASMKFSKIFPDVQNRSLGLDQLRHILQPYARYSFVSTDDLGPNFPSIDRLALSTKLRPLDITRYTGIDDLRNWSIVRVGMNNQLLTRRNGGSFPWLSMNTYMDVFLQDPEFNRDYSNLFNELTWSPLPWLTAGVDAQFPVGNSGQSFSEVNSYLHFQPVRNFEFQLGHFFLQDNPFFEDSNSFRVTTYTRLSDTWGFGTAHYYEMERDLLQLQQYSIHRDFDSWTAMFGAQIRDNDTIKDYGFLFSLTLKAFPRLRLPVDYVVQPF